MATYQIDNADDYCTTAQKFQILKADLLIYKWVFKIRNFRLG